MQVLGLPVQHATAQDPQGLCQVDKPAWTTRHVGGQLHRLIVLACIDVYVMGAFGKGLEILGSTIVANHLGSIFLCGIPSPETKSSWSDHVRSWLIHAALSQSQI